MNSYHDPELEDVLQDAELRRVASLLSAAKAPEPPLDEAFRTGLRRQLMQEAWSKTDGRGSWLRRAFAPPGIARAGAAVGPTAKTASNQPLAAPQTITFVTQAPTPTPAPPTPRPTPANPLSEKQVVTLNGASRLTAQWSADSSSIYFVDGKGALVVTTKAGAATVIAADGVSSPAISPAGDRLAYIRGAKIEVLDFASGKTDELSPTAAPTIVGWAKDKLVWAASDGVYTPSDSGPSQVAPMPSGSVTLSI